MEFLFVAIIIIFIFVYNKLIDTDKFINEVYPMFKKLMEKDYEFLLRVKYGEKDIDVNDRYGKRIRDGILGIAIGFFALALTGYIKSFYLLIPFILGFFLFKSDYMNLKKSYKSKLHYIEMLLPYYLKGLEILVQHYTVPVALSRSIDTAPEIFKPGLRKLVARIDEGDSTIQPYIDFANEYPVRDSMRMMRLLYRLSLGSQKDKHEQVMQFSRTVSSLQNKAREQKYKERLEHIENQTMIMLFSTGGGVLALLFLSMSVLMSV